MKIHALAALLLLTVAGCTTAEQTKPTYDLTRVCLTDEGKAVSEGVLYKGKTCSKPDTSVVYPKPNLVWR